MQVKMIKLDLHYVNPIFMFICAGVDSGWDVILVFKNDRRAVLKCSSKYRLGNSARIAGTTGCIEVSIIAHRGLTPGWEICNIFWKIEHTFFPSHSRQS